MNEVSVSKKTLYSIILAAIIVAFFVAWFVNGQFSALQNQNGILLTQNNGLQNQNSELAQENGNLEMNVSLLQNQTGILQNQASALQSQNGALTDQNTALQNQVADLQTQLSKQQNQTKKYAASLYNFSTSGPDSLVFSVSAYDVWLTVKNTGNTTIENAILEANLTLSNGQTGSTYFIPSIQTLNPGETQQIRVSAQVYNVVVNLYSVRATWHFVLKIPEVVLFTSSISQ
jgi:cell division protein FtsB